jgi:hypothetical protein
MSGNRIEIERFENSPIGLFERLFLSLPARPARVLLHSNKFQLTPELPIEHPKQSKRY